MKLVGIGLEDADKFCKMQVEAFQYLYVRYQDTESISATEKIDKIIMRLNENFYFIFCR